MHALKSLGSRQRKERAAIWMVVMLGLFASACGSKTATFSLLADQNNFQQNTESINAKMDILWVIDNSGSMASSQQNVAENFGTFIDRFAAKGFDYRQAVTTSEAWRDTFDPGANRSRFRDGSDHTSHTGVFVLEPLTPNLIATFLINMMQGISGSGDERSFASIKSALNNPENAGFPRTGAFLAIIIVSDEDDFSTSVLESHGGQYSYTGLHTVQSYVDYLDEKTGATAVNRQSKYNVNAISIYEKACLDLLNATIPGRKIGRRYKELVDLTNGVKGSLCDDFGPTLANISAKILELSTQFYLNRIPNVSSIAVTIDGQIVPTLTEASPIPWDGFMYHSELNSITFHGNFVPGPGAAIGVRFDPLTLK